MPHGTERKWVSDLRPRLEEALQNLSDSIRKVEVRCECRLAYTHEIYAYEDDFEKAAKVRAARYTTDLLIYEVLSNQKLRIPRVTVECKLGNVTTHDALTYSAKAATHKHVHPYLRYGILIADYGKAVPYRLMRHGAYFDFMTVWGNAGPHEAEWSEFIGVLIEKIRASRLLHEMLAGGSRNLPKYSTLHRPLRLISPAK